MRTLVGVGYLMVELEGDSKLVMNVFLNNDSFYIIILNLFNLFLSFCKNLRRLDSIMVTVKIIIMYID
jgi:hypothetical protein